MYIIFETSNEFYNNAQVQKSITELFEQLSDGYPITLTMLQVCVFYGANIKCVDSHGWLPYMWNIAFQHAIDDGADYFFQLLENSQIETLEWSEKFTSTLLSNPKPDFGVTGPVDTTQKRKRFSFQLTNQETCHLFQNRILRYLVVYSQMSSRIGIIQNGLIQFMQVIVLVMELV